MTVMEDVYYFTLISGCKLARDHLSICSKYLGKPEKNRGREWGQKAQAKYIEKIMKLKIVQLYRLWIINHKWKSLQIGFCFQ